MLLENWLSKANITTTWLTTLPTDEVVTIMQHRRWLQESFEKFLREKKYKALPPQNITSGIDPTVLFIGSHSSVVKPMMFAGEIPDWGVYLTQPCVRTQNVKKLFTDTPLFWWSNFTTLWKTLPPNKNSTIKISEDTMQFLLEVVWLNPSQVCLRWWTKDTDLLGIIERFEKEFGVSVELDTSENPERYYRHRYGEHNVRWRNFNFAVRMSSENKFWDIWNVVVMENPNNSHHWGTELWIGNETLTQYQHWFWHIFQSFAFADLIKDFTNQYELKLRDSISTSFLLLHENLKPSSEREQKVLRSYIRAILFYISKLWLDLTDLTQKVAAYEKREYWTETMTCWLQKYLTDFEKYLLKLNNLSKEESTIKNVLMSE